MKYFLLLSTFLVSTSVYALDMSQLVRWFNGTYKNIRSADFACPDKMKKFGSQLVPKSVHGYYEVACEDGEGRKYGLIFIGDVLVQVQHSDKSKPDFCKSRAEFDKFYAPPNFKYKYQELSNFEKQYIYFATDYKEGKKNFFLAGLCSKNKFFATITQKTKPALGYMPTGWITK